MTVAKKSLALTKNEHMVIVKNAKAVTTSRKIAETFGKNHKDVLRDIKNLGCSSEFNERNFAPVKYKDAKGEVRPEYQITKDGAVMLIMGYTGERAMQFKETYIDAFNTMEQKLHNEVLPIELTGPYKGLQPIMYMGKKHYLYQDALKRNNYSTKSGSRYVRCKKYPTQYKKVFGRVIVSEDMCNMLSEAKQLEKMRQDLQLELSFEAKGGNYGG